MRVEQIGPGHWRARQGPRCFEFWGPRDVTLEEVHAFFSEVILALQAQEEA